MELARPATANPFITVQPLPAPTGPAPAVTDVDWRSEPADTRGLVTVRYFGTETDKHGSFPVRFSVRNDPTFSNEPWFAVQGSLDDAIRAARDLAIVEGGDDRPADGQLARTSVAVLAAGEGAWHLSRMNFPEGAGDGMDAIISMPIDRISERASVVSVPYGRYGARSFDTPTKVQVRFDDPRVAALVGVDSVALAPTAR